MVFIYTTCKDMESARKLGQKIIESKIGACVDMWPIESMYYWKGEFQSKTQAMLMVSTIEKNLQGVDDLMSVKHEYNTPMIAGVDVRRINHDYKEWMAQTLQH
jgi:periplasmic divalent cation tolerance protein